MSFAHPIQFKGSLIAQKLLRLLGWKCFFNGLPQAHGVLIFYPHTSNWDFIIGILAKWAMGAQFNFLAKHTLFQIPGLGAWLKYVGGMPIIRSAPQGYVQELIDQMGQRPYFWVAVAPEGTRRQTPGWRSGFYRLAIGASLPIGMAYIDYKRKEVGVTEFFNPTGDEEKDLMRFRDFYSNKCGFSSDLAAPIVFWTPPKE